MLKLKRIEDPILKPEPQHTWESRAVLNPAAVREGEKIHMLFRAVEGDNLSTIGYAVLDRYGRLLQRSNEPLIEREFDYEKQGAEDPRITQFGGRYYVLYSGYDGLTCRVCMASTDDFVKVQKHGVIIPEVWDKDAMLFPEPVRGKIILMHRIEPSIQLAWLDDIEQLLAVDRSYWNNHFAHLAEHTVLSPRCAWEAEKIGGGAPPIMTDHGWLVIYHGVDRHWVYRAGAALLELDNPNRVIARLPYPILEPQRSYEMHGDVANVIFPEGTAVFDGELQVFYGGADKVIAMAVASLEELLCELLKHKE